MSLEAAMLAVMVPLLIVVMPRWAYSRHWGYGPSVGVTVAMLLVVAFLAAGRL